MEETKQILTAILGKLDEMGADIRDLKRDVAELKADVAVMKGHIAGIKESHTRHERILELLSIKSIDHEASIRDIRKTQES